MTNGKVAAWTLGCSVALGVVMFSPLLFALSAASALGTAVIVEFFWGSSASRINKTEALSRLSTVQVRASSGAHAAVKRWRTAAQVENAYLSWQRSRWIDGCINVLTAMYLLIFAVLSVRTLLYHYKLSPDTSFGWPAAPFLLLCPMIVAAGWVELWLLKYRVRAGRFGSATIELVGLLKFLRDPNRMDYGDGDGDQDPALDAYSSDSSMPRGVPN